jgi:hypothetical protein
MRMVQLTGIKHVVLPSGSNNDMALIMKALLVLFLRLLQSDLFFLYQSHEVGVYGS